MAMKCDKCGKGCQRGNYVSHAKNRTKRKFKPNLKQVSIKAGKVKKKMLVCVKCLRKVKKASFK